MPKTSELITYVTVQDLKDTIEELENGNKNYLKLNNNLFSIKDIQTCLHVKQNSSWFNKENVSFKFSYIDQNFGNLVIVKYLFEDDSVYAFLKETEFLNEEQIQQIYKKVMANMKLEPRGISLEESTKKANDMLASEALCILTSGINRDDISAVMNDFEYKLKAFRERKQEINGNAVELMNALYDKLLVIKLSEAISG